jgi:Flp pilus assembly protein TadD
MNKFATKFAASTMVLTMTMVGCHSDSVVASATASTAQRSDQQAARFNDQAREALQRGDTARALTLAERAVELAPRDSGYRMLLADLYLKNGRFRSAESSYADVIELDPANVRAGLSVALTQIAQGRNGDALVELERLQESAPASDVGLAMALAGQPQRAVALLESAARGPEANGRTRQNLAFAYALSGDWQRARTVAAQDVSPAELNQRLQHWATMAQPAAPWSQVAGLLGVTPAEDPGQPVRLALSRPEPEVQAFAEAQPEPVPEPAVEAPVQFAAASIEEPAPEPVQYEEPAPVAMEDPIRYADAPVVPVMPAPVAEQAVVEAPVELANFTMPAAAPAVPEPTQTAPESAPAAPEPAPVHYAAAMSTLSAPQPVLTRASIAPARASRPVFRPAPVQRVASTTIPLPRAGGGGGRFVVQLGAFSNPQNAERAWIQAESRFGLANAEPRTTTINIGGRTLHRVSVAGFDNRAQAARVCESIRGRGGACFVRATAGDMPVRWASRGSRARRA